jgi:hypothetical protein
VTTGGVTTGGVTTGGVTTGGVTTGGVTTGGVTTGGVTTGVVGAVPPLLVVATVLIKVFDSGKLRVGSGLKAVVNAVRLAVWDAVATLDMTTAAKFLPASVIVLTDAGKEPLLALESIAIAFTLSKMDAVGAACAKDAR